MNKRGEPKNIERLGNVRIIDSNTGVAFVVEEKKPLTRQEQVKEFIKRFKAMEEEYNMQVHCGDPFLEILVHDKETGKDHDLDGESY